MRRGPELFQEYARAGFTLLRTKNKAVFRCPCGHTQISVPRTPSAGHRSIPNTTAWIKRTLRVCAQHMEETA